MSDIGRYHIEFKSTTGEWCDPSGPSGGLVVVEGCFYKTVNLTRNQAIETAGRIPRAGPRSVRIRPGAH